VNVCRQEKAQDMDSGGVVLVFLLTSSRHRETHVMWGVNEILLNVHFTEEKL
jgi:hypothetical protein